MTTIAVDARKKGEIVMVADNLETSGWKAPCTKIYDVNEGINKGDVVGTTGSSSTSMLFVEYWRAQRRERDYSEFHDTDFFSLDDDEELFECALIRDGAIYYVDRLFLPIPVELPFAAFGSGGMYAMGAMLQGADAVGGVEVACQLDPYTGKMGRPLQVRVIKR